MFGVTTSARFNNSSRDIFHARMIKQFHAARRRLDDRIEHDIREFVAVEKFRDHNSIAAVGQACRS